jgi:hypothetical protein
MYRSPLKTAALALGATLGVSLIGNWRSLVEGVRYLRHMQTWQPDAVEPVRHDGLFGICHELVALTNIGRHERIVSFLRDAGLEPELYPVPDEPLPNILVRFDKGGPTTLFVAHYDLSRETPTYQGASDNTAAVSVLLAVARTLSQQPPRRSVALLFTSAEETGMLGAKAFVATLQQQPWQVDGVVNSDMLGRGAVATRPSAPSGIYFWLPGVGTLVFDGRKLRRGKPYPLPDHNLISRLEAAVGQQLVQYERFTANSDSVIFQRAGLPTVSLSSDDMYYLDRVWDRDADRVELLDERNLMAAYQLFLSYAQQPQ